MKTFSGLIRTFSSQPFRQLPLQPAHQRKTTPFRHPKRPHLPDPIHIDPSAKRFSLIEDPEILFVMREPKSLKSLQHGHLSPPPAFTPPTLTSSDSLSGLSHPILSLKPIAPPSPSSQPLPPPVLRAQAKGVKTLTPEVLKKIQTLRSQSSLTQLSQRFGVSRLSIQILGCADRETRTELALRQEFKHQRRQHRWSVSKLARREERRARRSLW